jgi:hypothetical protein
MSKPNGFIRIEREFWADPKVAELPAPCQIILVDMLYRYTGSNNGRISYSWEDAQRRVKCSRRMVGYYFAKLRDAGLIEVTVKGSFDLRNGTRKGTANQYRLTFLRGSR